MSHPPDDRLDADVAIVGCGPVGNTLAILLAQHGHRVVVLERWPEPYPLPRAVHFDHEVGRIFQSCGIAAEVRPITEPAAVYEWRNADGATLLRLGRTGDGPSGWPLSSMFNQPALEALLDRRARELPGVTIRRDAEVTGIESNGDTVTVRAETVNVTARFAIGCDGANSTVRSLTDLPVHDLGFFFDWLIVDVILDEPRTFDPVNVQICDPVRPTTAVSGGPGRRRWEFMRLPGETMDELNDEARAWELLAPWDVHPDNASLERHAVYTFNARYAEQWRADRVLLAGDAAHLMPPFAGQGMCAGVRDAANLAWKLDLVLSGHASESLLDTYQQERLPNARAMIDFSMELGKIICVPDPAEAAARDDAMIASVGAEPTNGVAPPPLASGFLHPDAPHAGELFVQGTVNGRPFDDVHGAGWRLILLDDPNREAITIPPATRDWFESIGGSIVHLAEPNDTYRRWFATREMACVVQRPDFYVYGAGAQAGDAGRLLDDLRADLDPNPKGASS